MATTNDERLGNGTTARRERSRAGRATSGGVVASADVARRVQALMNEHGVAKTALLLGCGREVAVRLAARQPVRRGSLLLCEKNLGDLDLVA